MTTPLLSIQNVSKRFGGLMAVSEVSFDVAPGEIVGLIGPNGAGKTTLFNLISGYLPPTEGRVRFLDRDVTGKKPNQLASLGIGRTFQIVKPFAGLSVLENITVASFMRRPRKTDAVQKAWEVMEFTGLADRAHQQAAGLTLAGRKRLEIGKALALDPKLILLDEVVAGLNPTEADRTVDLIMKIQESGVTVLIVEHIMRVIMNISHRVVVLNYGCLISHGKPEAVAKDPVVIEAYLGESN
jgi:branched-chain amino acid transport system ATP-binding protein